MIRPEDREVLIGQVAYLVDELHAQQAIIGLVPEPLWASPSPTGEHSLLELYGLLVGLGERSYPGLIAAWSHGNGVESIDELALLDGEPWNVARPEDLITRAVSAREAVVASLEAVEDWAATRTIDGAEMTLADVAFRITQEDAAVLRAIGARLHEADLGTSPVSRLS